MSSYYFMQGPEGGISKICEITVCLRLYTFSVYAVIAELSLFDFIPFKM